MFQELIEPKILLISVVAVKETLLVTGTEVVMRKVVLHLGNELQEMKS